MLCKCEPVYIRKPILKDISEHKKGFDFEFVVKCVHPCSDDE